MSCSAMWGFLCSCLEVRLIISKSENSSSLTFLATSLKRCFGLLQRVTFCYISDPSFGFPNHSYFNTTDPYHSVQFVIKWWLIPFLLLADQYLVSHTYGLSNSSCLFVYETFMLFSCLSVFSFASAYCHLLILPGW